MKYLKTFEFNNSKLNELKELLNHLTWIFSELGYNYENYEFESQFFKKIPTQPKDEMFDLTVFEIEGDFDDIINQTSKEDFELKFNATNKYNL